ncbi:beta-ketoacyl-[acyl-carrier-protein] synthase family protein [Bacillus sp. REN10]|uniref:beta-ketoacyl-[acyl-carrier-protein] synthase family protein n=1 Tax=Bacillus sp. REN10 TaxID=2782541 RepID=UPI00193C3DCA|nr:beta-ketoacyl-[acyl-carrier-protein] synthase family protein [Bacillus sp. REN10]
MYIKQEIAVTGMGIICSNGQNIHEFSRNIKKGVSGISLSSFNNDDFEGLYTGEIKKINQEIIEKYSLDHLDDISKYSLISAYEAFNMSELDYSKLDPYRIGIFLGTSLGGIINGEKFLRQWLEEGIEKADGSLINHYPLHSPSDVVASALGIKGPKTTISNACAAGSNAIGVALNYIRANMIDVALVGGADPLSKLSLSGFNSLNALSNGQCAPFSKSDGINIGEGAGFLVLERKDKAKQRNAHILAEVYDYALSADCYHPTAPDPAGSGALQAMRAALENAKVKPEEVSYINAHGTGTLANDMSEPKAIRSLMKENIPSISSTKSMTGHMLGAAGIVEAITSILAIRENMLPPTINFDFSVAKYNMDFVPNRAKSAKVDIVLSNSFAFGGNNCSVLLGKYKENLNCTQSFPEPKVVITGIGAIAGNAENIDEVFQVLSGEREALLNRNYGKINVFTGEIGQIKYEKFINPSYVRKMDKLSKQAVLTAKQALTDAELRFNKNNSERVGLIFATGTGPLETVHSFYKKVLLEGPQKASAKLFPNTVMNAAAGHIGMNLKIKGPTSTICAGGVSGINALYYGNLLIKQNVCDQVVIVSSDEFSETLLLGASRIKDFLSAKRARPFDRRRSGLNLGSGSVAIILENEEIAKERNKEHYASLSGFGMTSDNARNGSIDSKGSSWKRAMESALTNAGLVPEEIQLISSAGSGHKIDILEAKVIDSVFNDKVMVNATKSLFGETHATAGMLGVLDAINAFSGTVSGIGKELDSLLELNYVTEPLFNQNIQNVFINAYSFGGNYQSLILSK